MNIPYLEFKKNGIKVNLMQTINISQLLQNNELGFTDDISHFKTLLSELEYNSWSLIGLSEIM